MTSRLRTWHQLDRSLITTGGALILSAVVNSGLGFLYWLIAAHELSVSAVGLGASAIASMILVTNLSQAGLSYIGSRFLPAAGDRQRWLARWIEVATFALGALGGLIFWGGSRLWADHIGELGVVFCIGTALMALFSVQDQLLLGLGRAGMAPAVNAVFGISRLVLLVVALQGASDADWRAVVWPWWASLVIGTCLEGLLIERFAARPAGAGAGYGAVELWSMIRFALVNHLSGALFQLPALLFPVLVLRQLGEAAAAYFYTAWMIVALLLLNSTSITTAMVAQAARPDADVPRLLRLGLRYAVGLAVPGALGLIIIGRPVLSLFGDEYRNGFGLLVILAISSLGFSINTFYVGIMRVQTHLRPVLLHGAIVGGLTLALVWPLGSRYGLEGFGLAYVAGHTVAALFAIHKLTEGRWSSRPVASNRVMEQSLE